MPRPLYFDCNATTAVHPRVLAAMLPFFADRPGNPGCAHEVGLDARQAMECARAQVAALLGMEQAAGVVFTGGATEANHLAVLGTFMRECQTGPGWLAVSAVEHPAVLGPARVLERRGVQVVALPVDARGVVERAALEEALHRSRDAEGPKLVSVMLANNETGVLQPVAEIAALAHAHGALLHTDAAQAVGKIPVNLPALGADYLTIAGHKMYAPKGVGALVCASAAARERLSPLVFGGGQEGGLRSGTENIPLIVALGEACALAAADLPAEAERQAALAGILLDALTAAGVAFVVHGQEAPRLPQTLSLGLTGRRAGDVLSGLVMEDVAVSGGAACHGGTASMSGVLQAMGVDPRHGLGTVRISWGRFTTVADMQELAARLVRV
ncbi:cysteine desulfurase family protein [Megalodesulfovibrio gigas]|uniref:cysteine desulfurase n=1 Tax=Megalodesulfovibrio gigas (strain ATCC 19364 / DSM 1382 / NCIMB 9332 / VKM B-1759) TaxID=1121448 RepID=T2GC11_MEGG1|nr:cysteine desulfurase family protein [Megalodesulfovibrio gigas]AGW14100.1 putative cysteine desulfurase [Megalodesulfovibrio gigas DSM 1382 = ATCC 19364]